MKKYLIAIAVVFLLIIFPIGSWYYLNSGFNYRKSTIQELKPKEKVDVELGTLLDMTGKTTLIHRYLSKETALVEKLNTIYDQFGKNESFQILSILKPSELYTASEDLAWKIKQIPDSIFTASFLFENSFTLIDTGLNVRNYYNSHDTSFTKLVEHIALVLPLKKDLDLELRRQKEK